MKHFILLLAVISLFSCQSDINNTKVLQSKVDSLELQLKNTYKPGFGELMSGIQNHHAKLWFAGINKNWKLAEFEVHELHEVSHDVETYQYSRKESALMYTIYPVLDSVAMAIKNEDITVFKKEYKQLTNTCNSCHKKTDFAFNLVKIPSENPFSNQQFKLD